MHQNNKLQSKSQNTLKALRNTALVAALFATFQSCENATGASSLKPNIKDSTEKNIRYNDADIDTFETYLPYAEQRNQPIPAISPEDYSRIEQQVSSHTLRSLAQDEKPNMDSIGYIALHSTEHLPGQKEENVILYLQKAGKIHFIVKRDGTVVQFLPTASNNLVQIDHLGKKANEKSHASWNHDPNMTYKTIGIEVSAYPGQTRSEVQYQSIKKLLGYLGEKYHRKQKDIVTHTMVAYSTEYGMMRKHDPYGIEWDKLGLAPGSSQINRDVVSGDIAPNLITLYERLRKTKTGNSITPMNHQQAIQYLQDHYDGLNNAIILHKQRNAGLVNISAQRSSDKKARMSIEEINQTMKYYTPPREIIYKKKQASHKAHHRKR